MEWYTPSTLLAVLVPFTVFAVDIARRVVQRRIERGGCPLPPGPTALPLVGSALFIDTKRPWLTYTKWKPIYGDIMYLRLLDTEIIILNTTSAATKLLEKRSRIYSDRPFVPTLAAYGNDCNFGLSPYGEHWRLCRRIFQQTFNAMASVRFQPMQLRKARQLICNIIDNHDTFQLHFRTFSAAIAMSAVYDYEPSPRNDPMISIVDNYLQTALPGLAPGRVLLVTVFPFLLHMPDWLPCSRISCEAKEARAWRNKVVEVPYQYVKKRMESKDHVNVGMVSDHVIRVEKFGDSHRSEYETALKNASTTAFIGSTETTTSTLMTFTLAMVENPHIWKRAQAEIDAVIGTDRLPDFDDRPSLPYVEAILRETLRWRPVAPISVPHAVTDSDIYEGYYIPKGASIFVNVWAISRDEQRYPNGDKFIPERFMDQEERLMKDNPREFIFGFGRRKCPGRHTADASVWSAIATMLATLEFNLAKDADGNDITFEATFETGLTEHPNPFPCRLSPRAHISKEAIEHILAK